MERVPGKFFHFTDTVFASTPDVFPAHIQPPFTMNKLLAIFLTTFLFAFVILESVEGSSNLKKKTKRSRNRKRRVQRPPGWDGIIWGDYAHGGGVSIGKSSNNVFTSYHNYSPSYYTGNVFCVDEIKKKFGQPTNKYITKYPWVAYCATGHLGPMKLSYCGKCLKVTNERTKQSIIARIVDQCGNGGIDLDKTAFDAVDGDKQGYHAGQMRLKIQFVQC